MSIAQRVKMRSRQPCCLVLKIIGVISALCGAGLFAFYQFTSGGEYALFGATSILSATAGFCLASLIRK